MAFDHTVILACLQVPALPLQVLAREHPDWREHPMAVVDADRPQGRILWVNERARRARILPGMRYAPALLLCRDLRAGTVSDDTVAAAVDGLVKRLTDHAPSIEPSRDEPGVFWINATGLVPLHASVRAWADELHGGLTNDWIARLCAGSTRFGTWATVRCLPAKRPVHVFPDAERERRAALSVRLDRMPPAAVPPALRDTLARLDVHTVGRFLELPSDGLGRRFGEAAMRFHRFASGGAGDGGPGEDTLDAAVVEEPLRERFHLEFPETDVGRLLFLAKRLLHPLRQRALERGRAVRSLTLGLRLEDGSDLVGHLRPAADTLDTRQLLELVHLRLEALKPRSGVETFTLELEAVAASRDQLPLFRDGSRRVHAAADRALARLRADLGG
ncbi:MAG: Y-family DNA polymerase, partial [Planctomycetota bacterium]